MLKKFKWTFGRKGTVTAQEPPAQAPEPVERPVRCEGRLAFCEWRLAHQKAQAAKMNWKMDEAETDIEAVMWSNKRQAAADGIPYWEDQVAQAENRN